MVKKLKYLFLLEINIKVPAECRYPKRLSNKCKTAQFRNRSEGTKQFNFLTGIYFKMSKCSIPPQDVRTMRFFGLKQSVFIFCAFNYFGYWAFWKTQNRPVFRLFRRPVYWFKTNLVKPFCPRLSVMHRRTGIQAGLIPKFRDLYFPLLAGQVSG